MEYSSFSSASYDVYDVSDLKTGFAGDRAKASYSFTQTPKGRRGSSIFCEPSDVEKASHHFLDSCYMCKKILSGNKDIFMYRGDTPFCSEECRAEQIIIDEAKENGRKHSTSEKQKQGSKQKQSSQRIPVWAW